MAPKGDAAHPITRTPPPRRLPSSGRA
jgi:hypothetical protein